MPVLTIHDLGHEFGGHVLYEHLQVSLETRDRVGLVGPNGIGKTTLLQNLAGLLAPFSGQVIKAKDLSLGYLRQEAVLTFAGKDNTIYEEMLTVFDQLRQEEKALAEYELALTKGDSSEALLMAYGLAQEHFENSGGYQYQVDIKRVLQGLGFEPPAWNKPLAQLSGGQKTRALLARLLLEHPDLLILDEPTNHLDIAAVEWLEQTLRRWTGALIIVSHDRYFLDRTINQVWDLTADHPGTPAFLRPYQGNYSAFVRQRDESYARAQRLFVEEKARLESEVAYIRKHIAGGKSDQAKGRLRLLSRDLLLVEKLGVAGMAEYRRSGQSWIQMRQRAKPIIINEAARIVSSLRPPEARAASPAFRLPEGERSGRAVLRTRAATIGYPDIPLFLIENLRLGRGGRAALLGPNGSGKTTLLKSVMGQIRPLEGDFDLGHNVKIGYFAQAHDQLDLQRSVMDEVVARSDMKITEIRSLLAQYLFRGEAVFKQVGDLSGGERARLALALLALEGANLLLLDEPTNHLDIPSQEILQTLLEAFEGTIVLVSHDRYLVDRLATEIWVIEEGRLVVFPGTYEEYRRQQEAESGVELEDIDQESEAQDTAVEGEIISWDAWFDDLPRQTRDESKGQRQVGGSRRLDVVVEALEDAEDWLVRVEEALEEVAEEGLEERTAELESEKAIAQDEIDALRGELEEITP